MADAIRWMKSHPEETRQFGLNGRRVAENKFDRTVVLERITTHLERQVMEQ
jgi:hypothetical protein